jgi:hypothetical protein
MVCSGRLGRTTSIFSPGRLVRNRRRANVRFPPIADISRCLLARGVKRAVLLGVAALAGCTAKPEPTCPSIEALAHKDAIADGRAALVRGDRHLLTLGGFVGSVPGVENWDGYQLQEIEGTSDTATEACRRLGATAKAYATKYNQSVVHGS